MKVLIFTTRQLCYNSGYYFAHRIGEEIEKLGIECEYCEIPENAIPSAGTQIAQPAIENAGKSVDEEAEKMLESYIGKEYLAILDFNSKLPRLILDDESYYLDSIDAPFYNFILDHPLYHHSTLDCKLKNYYAFSIDENHCKYIQNFYPHIKAVYQVALGAENVISLENLQEKKKSILIMGTYRNPDIYMKQIYNMNKYAEKNMLVMLEKLENDNEMTVENALKCIINNSNIEKDSFPLILNKYYLVEMYYRNYYRKKMVDALVNTGFHIDIAGEWWESYDKINKLNDIKGIYTYVYNEVDLKERWRVENIIASIDKDNVIKGSFESKIEDIISENKRPTIGFYLDDKSVYKSNETNSGENNKNIRLTIDKSITEKIRNVLKSDEFNNLDNVGVVLLESKSGKIRAMVQKDESEANINLGIGQLGFEPGSIFKILTEAIALNEGLINVTDTFYCGGSICNNNGKPYAHGALTVSKAFELSCNDIYAKIGNLIGYENMLKYTTNLGLFNKVLGVSGENREEASGVMPKTTDGISNFAIGQCVTVTPLQIAGAINAVVNDGVYIKPSIIEDIVDDNNNIIENEQNKENRIFTSTTSKLVKMDMKNVVLNGTGTEAKVDGVIEGGKTGTATGEGGATTHGWFAGYFELNNNEYTLVVVTPNIQGRNENGVELAGGNTAAPIFREIIKSLIN